VVSDIPTHCSNDDTLIMEPSRPLLADRKDLVAPDCERVFIGVASADEFEESIPSSFFSGLAPFPEG